MRNLTSSFFLVLFILTISELIGQETIEVNNIVINKELANEKKFQPRKVTYLFTDHNSALIKFNPISLTFGGLLYAYQKVISQQLASHCPYEISCSEFSRQCIIEYGLIKGTALTSDRLTRCTGFTSVDMHAGWLNENNQIIDPIEKYKHHKRHKQHKHDHN
jgi:putative component of membrane protein insertase Oxa1/YidC/SpoIIIJ protein YidD